MLVRLQLGTLYAEDRKIGRFMFPVNMFWARIGGRTVRILILKDGSVSVYEKGRIKARLSGNVLQYDDRRLTLSTMERNGDSLPALFEEENAKLLAVSNGDGTMDYYGDMDPVILAFSTMTLCYIRVGGKPKNFKLKPEHIIALFGSSRANSVFPLSFFFILGTVIFILLSNVFNSGLYSVILIIGYGMSIVAFCLFLILTQFLRKVRIHGGTIG